MPVPNIGSTQRRLRLLGGVAASAVALAALGLLLSQGAPRWWRAILFLPFPGYQTHYLTPFKTTNGQYA